MAITVSADNAITAYLAKTDPGKIHPGFLAYIANLTQVASVVPGIARGIVQELGDQRAHDGDGVVGPVGYYRHLHRTGRLDLDPDELAAFVGRFVVCALASDESIARRVLAARRP